MEQYKKSITIKKGAIAGVLMSALIVGVKSISTDVSEALESVQIMVSPEVVCDGLLAMGSTIYAAWRNWKKNHKLGK